MGTLPFSKFRRIVIDIAILLLVAGISYRAGERRLGFTVSPDKRVVVNTEQAKSSPIDFSLFWDVWNRVHRYYIDAAGIDNQKLVWGAISGMVNAVGDPYTTFLPPKENEEFKQDIGGSFEGIGAQLGIKENRVMVVAPLKGSPAEKEGIRSGDFILKVNDEETINWTVPQAVSKIRGKKGTTVNLSILHDTDTKPTDIAIVRDTIVVPAVDMWVKKPSEVKEISGIELPQGIMSSNVPVAYIHLSRFGDRLDEEWTKAVLQVVAASKNQQIAGLILDLRNNPGGYLDGSVYIGSEFMNSGTVVVQENSDGTKQEYKASGRARLASIPLIVIINKGSASASEIVAGALKDTKRATVVGETSFGKGSVQTPQELSGGASLHVTTGKWLTPKGEWISKKGITPDVEVVWEGESALEASHDAQLAKAIELLLQ